MNASPPFLRAQNFMYKEASGFDCFFIPLIVGSDARVDLRWFDC